MNILLIGEYSRLHNSLKEGLQALGHEVVICGLGDGFKKYPIDLPVYKRWDSGWRGKIKSVLFRLYGFDLSSWLTYRQFLRYAHQLKGFDVVQLINENSFLCDPETEIKILTHLFNNNEKVFLLSCGNDYLNVQYNLAHPDFKSVLQPYLQGKVAAADFTSALKFTKPGFKKLHEFIYSRIAGVIATDLDYVPAIKLCPLYAGFIAYPVNVDQINFKQLTVQGKVKIFHGVNSTAYYKKGSDHFVAALEHIEQQLPDRVKVTITRDLPYQEYIESYDDAHIILDQTYSIDQGYNALEAMAKGKIAVTGANHEFYQHYQLNEKVNINAEPNVLQIVDALKALIFDRSEMTAISLRARKFIEVEHHYIKIAGKYVECWQRTT